MLKQSIGILMLALILANTGCSNNESGGMPPATISAATAKLVTWQSEVTAIGTLSASQGIQIKPQIQGEITGVYFRSGDYVKAGTPLIQIYPDILKAQLETDKAKAQLSKANYERAKTLFKKKVYSQADMDTYASAYKSDKATVANDQAQLNQTLIRAPFSGRLGLRLVNLGDYVAAGQEITNLEATDPLRVDFPVSEAYLSQLALGQTVLIDTSSYPNTQFKGTVYAIDSIVDPNTRTIGIRASIPNKQNKLMPGAFVNVTLVVSKPQTFVAIPQSAIMYSEKGEYVYKIIDNKAVTTPIVSGMQNGDTVAVLSGLKNGDVVISAGQNKTVDGGAVVVSNN